MLQRSKELLHINRPGQIGEGALFLQLRAAGLTTTLAGATQDLAIALAALMRLGPKGRAGLKLELPRRLRASTLDEARLFLLVNRVETYL